MYFQIKDSLSLIAFFLLFLCLPLFMASCRKTEDKKVSVDLADRLPSRQDKAAIEGEPLRVAIAAMISPKETVFYYDSMMNYVGQRLGRPVDLVQKKTYDEVNAMVEKKELDLAFVCSGPYVQGKRKFGMELLVAPLLYGKPFYQAYIIVHKNSPFTNIQDLKGKSFAFTDPSSNTGKLVPTYILAKMGTTPSKFFRETSFTYSHDNSIRAVSKGLVDGASVDGLIWDFYNDKRPDMVQNTKIIFKSPLYGIPPVVVNPDMSLKMKEELKKTFLNMHEDPEGKKILAEIRIEKFVVPDDASYNSVRDMQGWIEKNQP